MKHKSSIIIILLCMFLITQFIGLAVINSYTTTDIPYGLEEETNSDINLISILISMIMAIAIVMLLMKWKIKWVMRLWFFSVVTIAISLAIYGLAKDYILPIGALSIGFLMALWKTLRPTRYSHNLTELLIYPGIAPIFVSFLNPYTISVLLIIISVYDMWAVWHSKIMQKMAKFQMEEVGIFGGFLIPKLTKKQKLQIKNLKKTKEKKLPKKFKVELAILGGGDVIFPLITAGVFMRAFNSIIPALFIIFGALTGLIYLFSRSEQKKSYPAMPYISVGIFLGIAIWLILKILM